MGLIDCCKCISFFGVLFYVAMGLIILLQSQFLKFKPQDKKASVGACFITAIIQAIIFLGIMVYQNCQGKGTDRQEDYYDLRSQRDIRKDPALKQIAMGDLKMIRQQSIHQ